MLKVGITAVGSGIGQAILDSIRLHVPGVHIVGFDASEQAGMLYKCDEAYRLPLATAPGYSHAVAEHCHRLGIDLLIPGSDPELPNLSVMANELRRQGTDVVVSASACVKLCRDKLNLALHLRALGLPFVETWSLDENDTAWHDDSHPLVIKHKSGSGSQDVYVVSSASDWQQTEGLSNRDDWVVQPYLMSRKWSRLERQDILAYLREAGRPLQEEELSVQLFIDRTGQIQGKFASINRLKQGIPTSIYPINDPVVWRASSQIVAALIELGLWGPVNLQGRITDDGPCFFEINPRFTGITHVRTLMGYQEVEAGIRHFGQGESGQDIRPLLNIEHAENHVGLRQMTEIIVPKREVNEFLQTGSLTQSKRLRRALITGVTGYLGLELAVSLLRTGKVEEIVAPIRTSPPQFGTLDHDVQNRIQFIEWQELESSLFSILSDIDIVVHSAAARPPSTTSTADMYGFNINSTKMLVHAARLKQVSKFIFMSSQAVYGLGQPRPWEEGSTAMNPETQYAHSKAAAEAVVETLSQSPTQWVVLRLSRLYGWGRLIRLDELPHRFLSLALAGEPIVLHGDGSQEMDLLNVNDAVACISQLVSAERASWNTIYNVGSGNPVSVRELGSICIEIAENHSGRTSPVEFAPRDQPPPNFGMSIDRIYRATHWKPTTTLRDGLLGVYEGLNSE